MKIIDLLNKIAKGDIPKEIEYDGFLFSWDKTDEDYFFDEKYGDLFSYLFSDRRTTEVLNDEVEIIEEDKKIEPLKLNNSDVWTGKTNEDLIADKINEIIDYINKEE